MIFMIEVRNELADSASLSGIPHLACSRGVQRKRGGGEGPSPPSSLYAYAHHAHVHKKTLRI